MIKRQWEGDPDFSCELPATINRLRAMGLLMYCCSEDVGDLFDERDVQGIGLLLRDCADDLQAMNDALYPEKDPGQAAPEAAHETISQE